MSIKQYNKVSQQWEQIVPTQGEHDAHVAKIASATELGHVKIDETTLSIDGAGKISVIGAPDATTLAKGIVQLSNAIDLDSESLASTPKAVKDALAQAKLFTETQIANLIGSAPETLDTLQEIADAINATDGALEGLLSVVGTKADKTALAKTDETVASLTQTVTSNKTEIDNKVDAHISDAVAHITQVEREAWNAGSNVFVGTLAPANTSLLWVTAQ